VEGFETNATNRVKKVVMTRNMGAFDLGLRAFVVAPLAIVVAFILGAVRSILQDEAVPSHR
jgi:hypothetical protein